jgi:hypothetical protein
VIPGYPGAMRSVLVASAAAILVLSGCGGPSDEQQVRRTLERFGDAVAEKDYDRVCSQLLATELTGRLKTAGVPCGVALASAWSGVQDPTLEVLRVRVRSDRLALALVKTSAANQQPLTATFRMVKEKGQWKVGKLSGPQPPAPAQPQPGPGQPPAQSP